MKKNFFRCRMLDHAMPAVVLFLLGGIFLGGGEPASAAQDIDISTPEIEAVRASLTMRAERLFPFMDNGQVGIGLDGLLKIRSLDHLGLQERAALHRLVEDDNRDRLVLYQEVARANGFPDKVDEVQAIFAESWRGKAAPGWYMETAQGDWMRK